MIKQGNLFPDLPSTDKPLRFRSPDRPIWTENKAKLIERYLYYFVMITKHGAYIDGFAGPQYPDKQDAWAAKLVIESKPPFLRKFWLCETSEEKLPALYSLASASFQKGRSIKVLPGDFNKNLESILASGAITEKMATFCLLDQHTFECEWKSLQALAVHKKDNKIELFYFLATGWLDRAIAATTRSQHIVKAWWGGDDWKKLLGMRSFDRAQLFASRFRLELGYKHAHAWPIYDRESGARRVMYHMIHASDHDEAPKLMSRAYRKANEPKEELADVQRELFGSESFHKR
ncbi:three-Cys-motif partner protein TcmP [Bradyrhizobium sp. BWA-3-5]|uniref:three-Cys-motif partner protein TcmP n=1 Tax=Bradyrhizobium sp. BWA-3-5 TaxID=3080013 RepID=UPI00293EF48B|nr:three-Cys-motif partner protein TcmP [Bradyrhizobium sp. BWA-3-5]WOH65448.1 three-Cys-motif partner protein TcmP [Bradyrhizobium sp. BWA-3-5]